MEAMVESTHPWGRVGENGAVEVRIGDQWHSVGAYPDGTAEEALAFFTRKFDDLESQVSLAEQRRKAGAAAKDISKSLSKLSESLATPSCVGDLESLRQRVSALRDELGELEKAQAEARAAAIDGAIAVREKIVVDIEAIAAGDLSSVRWKETTATVDALFDAWKKHQQDGPKLPKATADALWKRFRSARNTIDRARRSHFQERDKAVKAAKSVKRDLIAQAEVLAPRGADGIPAYRDLLAQWKKAPRGPRALEDTLWSAFKAAGDALYQAKSAAQEAEDEANRENGDRKLALVEEFSDILSLSEHRVAVERLRVFHDRFRQIGPVPRAVLKKIDGSVAAFDKHVKKLEAEHWDKTNPEKQARNNAFLTQIDEQIAKLEQAVADAKAAGNEAQVTALEDELATKVAWRTVLTED